MEYKVALTPKAKRDLAAIWNYFARDDRGAATIFCRDLVMQAYTLKTFPERNRELAHRSNVRKTSFKSYVIIYKIHSDENRVEILRFWHAARDQRRLRLKEETTQAYQAVKLEA